MPRKVVTYLFMMVLVAQVLQFIPAVLGQPPAGGTVICYFHYSSVPQSVAGVSTKYTMDTTKDWSGNQSIEMISQIDFYLYPALASQLRVIDKISLHLWISNEKDELRDWYINATVNEQKSSGKTFVGNTLKQKTIRQGTQEFKVDIPVDHTFMENSSINVNLALLTSNLEEPPPNTKVYLIYDSANEPTNVELRVGNCIAIEWVKTFDENGTERTVFFANWTERIVWIQVNVTDPFGGYDINPVTVSVTLIWATGIANLAMSLKSDGLSSFSNIYHANWTYTPSSYAGLYDLVVSASDNSGNGVSADHTSFRLTYMYGLRAQTLDDVGKILVGANVVIVNNNTVVYSGVSDDQGLIDVTLAQDVYNITVYWKGSLVHTTLNYYLTSQSRISLVSSVYDVHVLVKNQFGTPIQDASVQLLLVNGTVLMDGTTDKNGLVVFEQLLPGEYIIRAMSSQTTAVQSINLERSQVVDISLTIPTSFPWEIPIILILIVSAAALLLFFNRRKKKVKLKPRSFEFFDELTGGGIPEPSIVMMSGDPESGGVLLCEELIYRDLQNNKPWVYVGFSDLPSAIRKRLKAFGHPTKPYEAKGKFMIIDCYSALAQVSKTRKEKRVVEDPLNLTNLSIQIMRAVRSLPEGIRVLIDSTSPLFNKYEPRLVVTFLHEIGARIKGHHGVFYYTIVNEGVSKEALTRLEEMSDCVIETRMKEEEGVWKRWLRVKKIIGRKIQDEPVQFEIDPTKGFTFYTKSQKADIRNRFLRGLRKSQSNSQ